MIKPIQDTTLGDIASALQQIDIAPERVARTRPLVEANNSIIARAARERLSIDDNPGDFIAWLAGFANNRP